MTFAFPLWVVGVGAVVLTAILFALQRLRVRERIVAVAGASLWLQAARATPPRMLTERFRRWLAFLLALAIVLLLWLGAARPERTDAPGERVQVFYLDAAAPMLSGGAWADAKRALIADVAAVPARRRTVILGDADGATLLEPGEPVALLARRLDGTAAAARPSAFARWARGFAARDASGRDVALRYYGSAAALAAARAGLPAGLLLSPGYVVPAVPDNRGIVALGASPAASGAWNRADVRITVAAADGAAVDPAAVRVTHADDGIAAERLVPLGDGRFVVRDVPADGAAFTVALSGDGFPADDRATLTMPVRRPVRVALAPVVPDTLRAVVRADTGLALVAAGNADVVIRRAGDGFGGDKPALILTDPATQGDSFVFATDDADERVALSEGLDRLGLAELDAARLADDLRRPVAVGFAPAKQRTIGVWAGVFAPGSSFAGSRAMPLFVAQGLRWLAGPSPWIPFARADAPLIDQSARYGLAPDPAMARETLNGEMIAGATAPYRPGGRTLAVSLLDRDTTIAAARPAPPVVALPGGTGGIDPLFAAAMLLAASLLAIEWIAYRRGAMP